MNIKILNKQHNMCYIFLLLNLFTFKNVYFPHLKKESEDLGSCATYLIKWEERNENYQVKFFKGKEETKTTSQTHLLWNSYDVQNNA